MQVADVTSETLRGALRGLDVRRQAFEANMANVETPRYLAAKVDFEGALRDALGQGNPLEAGVSTSRSMAPTRTNGNNVDVAQEMVGATEAALHEQLVINALNNKFRLLRTSATG